MMTTEFLRRRIIRLRPLLVFGTCLGSLFIIVSALTHYDIYRPIGAVTISVLALAVSTILLSAVSALISWNFIEQPILLKKQAILAWVNRTIQMPLKLVRNTGWMAKSLRRIENSRSMSPPKNGVEAGAWLLASKIEAPSREDHSRVSHGGLAEMVAGAAIASPVSRQSKRYWQRRAQRARRAILFDKGGAFACKQSLPAC